MTTTPQSIDPCDGCPLCDPTPTILVSWQDLHQWEAALRSAAEESKDTEDRQFYLAHAETVKRYMSVTSSAHDVLP